MKREREITITRERIKQLLDRHRGRKYVPGDFHPLMPLEEEDVLRLALRATDPDIVMMPREQLQRLHDFSRECSGWATELGNVFYDMEQERTFIPEKENSHGD